MAGDRQPRRYLVGLDDPEWTVLRHVLGAVRGIGSGTEAYFSYNSGDLHVVQLDSADSDTTPGSLMLTWLAADLAANTRAWTIVDFHHPPYTKGTHNSDNPADSGGIMKRMRENVVPILEAHGVGERHQLALDRVEQHPAELVRGDADGRQQVRATDVSDPFGDGAYNKAPGPHSGTVYVVSGTGSRFEGTITPWPALAVGLSELGSLAIDIDGQDLDVRMIRPDATVADHFRIHHLTDLFSDGFERGNTDSWSSASP